jgi:hypothetical protein
VKSRTSYSKARGYPDASIDDQTSDQTARGADIHRELSCRLKRIDRNVMRLERNEDEMAELRCEMTELRCEMTELTAMRCEMTELTQ